MMRGALALLAYGGAAVFATKTCNLDEHHPENGGFYIEGINGVINDIRGDAGKRADDGTWATGIEYNMGQLGSCWAASVGMPQFCEVQQADENGVMQGYDYKTVPTHTCARLRFEYAADSGSTVYELPSKEALDACDFSQATLICGEADGNPCDVLFDYDHEQKDYYYASMNGCSQGQKAMVRMVGEYEGNYQQCFSMGLTSSRITNCDCNHQLSPSTLIDPCHEAFVHGCLTGMPQDTSCCPESWRAEHPNFCDPDETDVDSPGYCTTPRTIDYNSMTRSYEGSLGTCISQWKQEDADAMAPFVQHMLDTDPVTKAEYDAKIAAGLFSNNPPACWYRFACPSTSQYCNTCNFYASVVKCTAATEAIEVEECSVDPNWIAWQKPMEKWVFAGSFTDDNGVMHGWPMDKPTIVTGVHQALALVEMGVDPAQIHATFGERGTSGSNYNGVYSDYNGGGGIDHSSTPYNPAHWPTDPSAEEAAMLSDIADLSPGCSALNKWCSEFNATLLDMHGWPDIIIAGPWFDNWILNADTRAKAAEKGTKIIQIKPEIKREEGEQLPGTWQEIEKPLMKSYLHFVTQFEELAIALGADEDQMRTDKENLCHQIAKFKEITFHASERGVRAMAGVLPYGTHDSWDNGLAGAYLSQVDRSPTLMMLEELGMQVLHVDTTDDRYYEYHFATGWPEYAGSLHWDEMKSTGYRTDGRVKVHYPVDFWLPEVRGALDFMSPEFVAKWPHPALVAKQYAYYPGAAQAMRYTFRHAADILRLVGAKLAVAQKLDPADTQCMPVDAISDEYHRTNGLAPGQYACWNPIAYDYCGHVLNENWKQKAREAGYVYARGTYWETPAREAGWNPPCKAGGSRSRKMNVPFANRKMS
jgi:hypothetical protein